MYGMEVYSEDGYKVFTTNGKIYYTLLGKCVAKFLQHAVASEPPPGMRAWYLILPGYIAENPDKYLTVLKINNNPVKLLDNIYTVGKRKPYPTQVEFFSSTAPEVYIYTREPIHEQASYGLSTFNELGELEFSAVRGNQVLQIEATYHKVMPAFRGANWTSGVVGNGVIITSMPIQISQVSVEIMHIRTLEVEMQLVNSRIKATVVERDVQGLLPKVIHNSRLILSIVKLPSWTVPTLTW